jgi:hypothetical protein
MLQLAIWWHVIRMLKSVQSPNHESRPLHGAHLGNAPRPLVSQVMVAIVHTIYLSTVLMIKRV